MKWVVTGDTHGNMTRFRNLHFDNPEEVGVIILGDAGCNYFFNYRDSNTKKALEKTGFHYYLVRGNHEERPENIETMHKVFDNRVKGTVFEEEHFPHIHYFIDGADYWLNQYHVLTIGGAYSVDKFYRLTKGYSWFPEEQLNEDERRVITNVTAGAEFDFVFTHTCPFSWQPTDLFLDCIDQSSVDNSMEHWMEELKHNFKWNIWLFGHFHNDRLVRPHVEMYSTDMEELDTIWERWNSDKELDWWLAKDPKYYWDEEGEV